MTAYDLTVFENQEQRRVVEEIIEELGRLDAELRYERTRRRGLEGDVKWLKFHTEPDLRYME